MTSAQNNEHQYGKIVPGPKDPLRPTRVWVTNSVAYLPEDLSQPSDTNSDNSRPSMPLRSLSRSKAVDPKNTAPDTLPALSNLSSKAQIAQPAPASMPSKKQSQKHAKRLPGTTDKSQAHLTSAPCSQNQPRYSTAQPVPSPAHSSPYPTHPPPFSLANSPMTQATSPLPPNPSPRPSYLSSSSSEASHLGLRSSERRESQDTVGVLPSSSTDVLHLDRSLMSRASTSLPAASSAETLTGYRLASGSYPKHLVRGNSKAHLEFEWRPPTSGSMAVVEEQHTPSSRPTNHSSSHATHQSCSSPRTEHTQKGGQYSAAHSQPLGAAHPSGAKRHFTRSLFDSHSGPQPGTRVEHSSRAAPSSVAGHSSDSKARQPGKPQDRYASHSGPQPGHAVGSKQPPPTHSQPMPARRSERSLRAPSSQAHHSANNSRGVGWTDGSAHGGTLAPGTPATPYSGYSYASTPPSRPPLGGLPGKADPDSNPSDQPVVAPRSEGGRSAQQPGAKDPWAQQMSGKSLLSSTVGENQALAEVQVTPSYNGDRVKVRKRRDGLAQGGGAARLKKGASKGRHQQLFHALTLLIAKYPTYEHRKYIDEVASGTPGEGSGRKARGRSHSNVPEQGLGGRSPGGGIRGQSGMLVGDSAKSNAARSHAPKSDLFSKVALESYQDLEAAKKQEPVTPNAAGMHSLRCEDYERVRTPFRVSKRTRASLQTKEQALAYIEWRLVQSGVRPLLQKELSKKLRGGYSDVLDWLASHLFVWGQKAFHACTPLRYNRSLGFFAAVLQLTAWLLYFYMAAEYPRYSLQQSQEASEDVNDYPIGPKGLVKWIVDRSTGRGFSAEYLVLWGARHLPLMEHGHDFWRWFTMPLLHQSFSHVFSNMLLSLFVAGYLERKYGTLRTVLVAVSALLTASFLSAALEDPCAVTVGASGMVFGLGAMYLSDMVFNFSTCAYPFVRLLGVLLFLVTFIITLTYAESTSHVSHVGGIIGGLLPSLLVMPTLRLERMEAAVPYITCIWLLVVLICLPIYIYGFVLINSVGGCGAIDPEVTVSGQLHDFFTKDGSS